VRQIIKTRRGIAAVLLLALAFALIVGGSLSLSRASAQTGLLAADTIEGGVNPVVPTRVFDSRNFTNGGLVAGNWYAVGTGAQNIRTVFVTLTVTETQCSGYLTTSTSTGPPANVSMLNWDGAGRILSNSLFINVTNAGVFYVMLRPGCQAHVIVDLNAWVGVG
jgi:hypothetical protein